VRNQSYQLETDLHWDDQSNNRMRVGIGMDRTKRLGKRIRATALPGFEEMRQCDKRIQDRTGQPDCGGGVSVNSIGVMDDANSSTAGRLTESILSPE